MTTKPDLDELDRLHAEATPVGWEHDCDEEKPEGSIEYNGCGVAILHPHANIRTNMRTGQDFCHADARLIVALRNAYPALKERILEAERQLGECETALEYERLAHDETRGYRIAAEEDRERNEKL